MNSEVSGKLQVRAERKNRKRQEKKDQIAGSALKALQELGYANTSLRDIAEKSSLSLGMLHYYFEDRTELILHCVSVYKTAFTSLLNETVNHAHGREAVINALAGALATTIVEEASTHRLWYDLRSQALFDSAFRPVVEEIEETLIDILKLAATRADKADEIDASLGYALIDGVFRYQLQNQITGTPRDQKALAMEMRAVLELFL
ncbi:TetR family transcriptional regulator [Marinobacter lipolyticus SM19]|uniref:TetR family transcriptional regulator n=1 Tax=Marinobacter lipolyticus SM19 TaxID=1318628 RepID=R8AXZ0_9GAMM|nr:TetR/AcrR family transcriptional regulator [Marinobacter lipolyticus]EON91198.1 TetR family transcriptional regulator [Marinobacter lipolyticus SM19]